MKYCYLLLLFFVSSSLLAKPLKQIKLAGPAAVISYPLMVMAEEQSLQDKHISLSFTRWKNPDQLRAMFLGNQVDITAMPSNLAAILFNKGHPVKLINISIWDIMTVVSRNPKVNQFSDLIGQEIVVPFKNDMPTIVLDKLLTQQLGDKKAQINYRISHNLLDSSQLLLAGQVDHALLIEPVTSMVIFRNNQANKAPLFRNINISKQWQKTFTNANKLPQAGLVSNSALAQNTQLLQLFHTSYQQKAKWCKRSPKPCAMIVKKYLPKAPIASLIEAIKHTELNALKAKKIQQDLESFYQILLNTNAKLIGNKLPTDDFYL